MTAADAEAYCASTFGGNLASIHSDQGNINAKQACDDVDPDSQCWIGLTDSAEEGIFAWTDGSPRDYEHWAPREPNDWHPEDGGEDSVQLWHRDDDSSAEGSWNDAAGDRLFSFVCETAVPTATSEAQNCIYTPYQEQDECTFDCRSNTDESCVAADDNACTDDILDSGEGDGMAFVGVAEPKNWDDAQQHCVSLGGSLAKILDEPGNVRAKEACAKVSPDIQCWIGLNDRTTEGTFAWQDGDAADFTHWAEGEPNAWGPPGSMGAGSANHLDADGNSDSLEDAVQFWHRNDDASDLGAWNDADPNRPNAFICSVPNQPACEAAGKCTYSAGGNERRPAGCYSLSAEYCGGVDLGSWRTASACAAEESGVKGTWNYVPGGCEYTRADAASRTPETCRASVSQDMCAAAADANTCCTMVGCEYR